jgi:hypothetical protein
MLTTFRSTFSSLKRPALRQTTPLAQHAEIWSSSLASGYPSLQLMDYSPIPGLFTLQPNLGKRKKLRFMFSTSFLAISKT